MIYDLLVSKMTSLLIKYRVTSLAENYLVKNIGAIQGTRAQVKLYLKVHLATNEMNNFIDIARQEIIIKMVMV